jgi:hypothetical protein
MTDNVTLVLIVVSISVTIICVSGFYMAYLTAVKK